MWSDFKPAISFAVNESMGSIHARPKGLVRTVPWVLAGSGALVVAFGLSLVLRQTGSYYMPVDGWGVDAFELCMGAICIGRYFDLPGARVILLPVPSRSCSGGLHLLGDRRHRPHDRVPGGRLPAGAVDR